MLWEDLILKVNEHLVVDANRRGTEAFRLRMIRNALVDLQRDIVPYRYGHSTTFAASDLTPEGNAHRGVIPTGATPTAFFIYSTALDANGNPLGKCMRYRLDYQRWNDINQLICGGKCSGRYRYSIAPSNRTFIVAPAITSNTRLELYWNGLKSDWENGDEVPIPEHATEAIAYYVLSNIKLLVDKDANASAIFMAKYVERKRTLYVEELNRNTAEERPDVYVDAISSTPNTITSGFRPDITSWAELAAIQTQGYAKPVIVIWVESGTNLARTMQLRSGTDATDTANGIQRPNDYSSPSNEYVWYQA